jgi:hypothetical protein
MNVDFLHFLVFFYFFFFLPFNNNPQYTIINPIERQAKMADDKNKMNKTTRNFPNNPLRPLEISQATYETLLLIFMNDFAQDDATKWFWQAGDAGVNNEYLKALGTFILGEPIGDYLWPLNWLKLVSEEFKDLQKWSKALKSLRDDKKNEMYVGTILEALIKRTAFMPGKFEDFLAGTNPIDVKHANKEPGSQRPFPSALTTRRVLEPLVIPYRKAGMYGDCNPGRSPVSNIESLSKWWQKLKDGGLYTDKPKLKFSRAFIYSMLDFYKANQFPDPEFFLPYMISLSPSLANARAAIQEYQSFIFTSVCNDDRDFADPFLSFLFGIAIPAIPNYEKNYLLLAEKFNANRDYMKVAVGPVIQNMVLPVAVGYGVFKTGDNLAKEREDRFKAQKGKIHKFFDRSVAWGTIDKADIKSGFPNTAVYFWQAFLRNLFINYSDPILADWYHWTYALSSRFIKADEALRDRDFVAIHMMSSWRVKLIRWCNIKDRLTRDKCGYAVLPVKGKDGALNTLKLVTFESYIQMIPRPQPPAEVAESELGRASLDDCADKVCAPPMAGACFTQPSTALF